MTKLQRKVRRLVEGQRNDFVIILHPGEGANPAIIEIREKGRRKGYTITAGGLYVVLAQREAENARALRRAKRRTKGGAR